MVKIPQNYHSQCESQQRVSDDVFDQAVSSQSLAYLPITGVLAIYRQVMAWHIAKHGFYILNRFLENPQWSEVK